MIHTFSFPTQIHFGPGARSSAAKYLHDAGARRPLIVTDRGIAALPMCMEFASHLREAGLAPEVFGAVCGNPTAGQVRDGVLAYQVNGADSVIGFGGGAALDVAKAVALMAVHEGDIMEYAWDAPNRRQPTRALPTLIAVPTTAGTGSEVGRSAVISDDHTHTKRIIFSPALLARAVFADPELTLALPPPITAATGMDALAHNVESYLSTAFHPLCDGVALEGARIAGRALPRAVNAGNDLAVRSDLLMASLLGGVAFQKDLGVVHSCAHALGAVLGVHHGLAVGVMLDHGMRFNAAAAPQRMAELARVCGAGSTASHFVDWLTQLKAEIALPAGLSALGATSGHVPKLLEIALADTCHRTNPRACTRENLEPLLRQAM